MEQWCSQHEQCGKGLEREASLKLFDLSAPHVNRFTAHSLSGGGSLGGACPFGVFNSSVALGAGEVERRALWGAHRRVGFAWRASSLFSALLVGPSNLVDPASSHMLVSKIKPCMSQYKLQHGKTVNGSLKQL